MGGSQVISEPGPITWTEIAAWQWGTGRRLNQWETQQITFIDATWLEATNKGAGQQREGQAVGEYCGQKDVEECRRMFGEGLAQACSRCPD